MVEKCPIFSAHVFFFYIDSEGKLYTSDSLMFISLGISERSTRAGGGRCPVTGGAEPSKGRPEIYKSIILFRLLPSGSLPEKE